MLVNVKLTPSTWTRFGLFSFLCTHASHYYVVRKDAFFLFIMQQRNWGVGNGQLLYFSFQTKGTDKTVCCVGQLHSVFPTGLLIFKIQYALNVLLLFQNLKVVSATSQLCSTIILTVTMVNDLEFNLFSVCIRKPSTSLVSLLRNSLFYQINTSTNTVCVYACVFARNKVGKK